MKPERVNVLNYGLCEKAIGQLEQGQKSAIQDRGTENLVIESSTNLRHNLKTVRENLINLLC